MQMEHIISFYWDNSTKSPKLGKVSSACDFCIHLCA